MLTNASRGDSPSAQPRRLPRVACCLAGLVGLIALCVGAGVRFNPSASMPVGFYMRAIGTPDRGSVALVCLPRHVSELALNRGYIPSGGPCTDDAVPVGKPVLAVPGDTIAVTAEGLELNGHLVLSSKALTSDRQGRPMPQMSPGPYLIRDGEIWLLSTHSPFSFDSRYFGAVKLENVRGYVRALWTWN